MDDDPSSSFTLTWEDDTEEVQTEEEVISAIENEIIPTQSEEFLGGVPGDFNQEVVEPGELVEEVVEEEVIQEPSSSQNTSLTEQNDPGVIYLQDGNVLVMHDGNNEASYTQEQLMEVTEEIITDQWGESCPEEIIIGSEEAVADGGIQCMAEEDIPLPTAQDEYTAARPYPCDFCSRRFRKKANLMNHMVAHQTDRPHGCNLCGLRYMKKSDLMIHLKSHAYVSEADPLNDDSLLLERTFDKPKRKMKGFGKGRKKKPAIKEEYESMFTTSETATTSANFDYQDETQEYMENDLDNQEYLSAQEDIKYPVIDPKKPFVCQHCGVGFAREKALASHSRIHGGDSPFECQKCGEMFWDISLMQEHTRSKHGPEPEYDEDEDGDYSDSGDTRFGTFYCPTCGLSFHRQDNLRRHQRIHIKEEFVNEQFGHICNVCGESFQEALDLLAHAEIHARGTEYRCMICGEQCPDETSLANHVQGVHKSLPPHTCALCGRTCKDSRALLKHSWDHSKVKSFGCTKCSKTFHNKARLKRHMLSHRNKVVQCDVCGEDFPDGRSLMNHRHSHSSVSGRQFPCKECGKTFGSRSSQQIHVRIHTGERPYGCRFCWKAFADGGTLRKHERIHTGEKPYACAVCPRAFNQRVVLREHIRSHHSGPDPKYSQSMTPYCCAVCSDMFATSQDLILHLIHHCDMNTAMKRQPQVGPRKYKRRRKLKPHELEIITHHAGVMDESGYGGQMNQEGEEEEEEEEEEVVEQEYEETIMCEEDKETRRRMRSTSARTSVSSPKTSFSESVSEMYSGLTTMEGNVESSSSSLTHLGKSPTTTTKIKLQKKGKSDVNAAIVVPSRPKMIHTQKTRVAVDDGRVRHKTKTFVTRTQPTEIKSSTGERIRPRTKNVNYHILNPEKFPLATFPTSSDQQTQEAVNSLLNATALLEATPQEDANGHLYTEEVIDQAPDVAAEQIVESQTISEEVPVPVGIIAVRTRRNSGKNSKNVIGPGSKVRLVKEGMIVSKLKRNSESQQEPECILPDVQHSEIVIKEEYVHSQVEETVEHNVNEEQHIEQQQQQEEMEEEEAEEGEAKEGLLERLKAEKLAQSVGSVINVKQEIMDPSALHELAEISMRHAKNSTNLYKCEMCDEVFTDRGQLLVHVPIHI